MKKTAVAVAVGFGLVWWVIALVVQGDTAKIRESQQRADAIHKKTMDEQEKQWKATLDRLDVISPR